MYIRFEAQGGPSEDEKISEEGCSRSEPLLICLPSGLLGAAFAISTRSNFTKYICHLQHQLFRRYLFVSLEIPNLMVQSCKVASIDNQYKYKGRAF